MKKEDVKIGMEIIMTEDYTQFIKKGDKLKILRNQMYDGSSTCFIVDHDGEESYLAPYCDFFEPTGEFDSNVYHFTQMIAIAKDLGIKNMSVSGNGDCEFINPFRQNEIIDLISGEYDAAGNYKIEFYIK